MTTSFKSKCEVCGSKVTLVTGPRRVRRYRRDLELPIPEDFAIPTCSECGERYLSDEEAAHLQEFQKPAFMAWQAMQTFPQFELAGETCGENECQGKLIFTMSLQTKAVYHKCSECKRTQRLKTFESEGDEGTGQV